MSTTPNVRPIASRSLGKPLPLPPAEKAPANAVSRKRQIAPGISQQVEAYERLTQPANQQTPAAVAAAPKPPKPKAAAQGEIDARSRGRVAELQRIFESSHADVRISRTHQRRASYNPIELRNDIVETWRALDKGPLLLVPPEIRLHIMTFLDVRSLLRLGSTCSVLRAESRDNTFWRATAKERLPDTDLEQYNDKNIYQELVQPYFSLLSDQARAAFLARAPKATQPLLGAIVDLPHQPLHMIVLKVNWAAQEMEAVEGLDVSGFEARLKTIYTLFLPAQIVRGLTSGNADEQTRIFIAKARAQEFREMAPHQTALSANKINELATCCGQLIATYKAFQKQRHDIATARETGVDEDTLAPLCANLEALIDTFNQLIPEPLFYWPADIVEAMVRRAAPLLGRPPRVEEVEEILAARNQKS